MHEVDCNYIYKSRWINITGLCTLQSLKSQAYLLGSLFALQLSGTFSDGALNGSGL